jgi:hypothetical protein
MGAARHCFDKLEIMNIRSCVETDHTSESQPLTDSRVLMRKSDIRQASFAVSSPAKAHLDKGL